MAVERKENDKEVEELRGEAEEVEAKVWIFSLFNAVAELVHIRWRII
jgi:hypothetical protein